jgi:dTDP-4-amino-4,6-dideoxygalactose transaminase
MKELALFGGTSAVRTTFAPYRTIGKEEAKAVAEVVASGELSGFLGSWSDNFFGGKRVRAFEESWSERFSVRHSVSMNSATSCLYAAVGAIGVGPGDEVIVSPFTMTASAAAILIYNAIPVFADVETETFNLDPDSVAKKITPHTKGIIVPNIFGHAARYDELRHIALQHGLKIIEDNAQSILATYRNRLTGTIGDIGVFSLNYHKHIHTGEGGVCVTDDDELAERLQLIRNHAEAVVDSKGVSSLVNMLGFNFRMTEIEAAIGIEQLAKCDAAVASRRAMAALLDRGLSGHREIRLPVKKESCEHSYYVYPIVYQQEPGMPHRDRVVAALKAEGVPVFAGYVAPLYLQPMYQSRIAYGDKGCPFTCPFYKGSVCYDEGICPVTEALHRDTLFYIPLCSYDFADSDIDDISSAFEKVFSRLDGLG